ncbi:MAG: hypothetical protein A2W31_10140 [Planctomycetes bacterium RBG_16_64_10]|nr:MAG: hypothetical protein A2W31_10140 [Planctomycetes bacterium RBG_16_64_10]
MIGHSTGLVPDWMRYSVNSSPSARMITPRSDFSAVTCAATVRASGVSHPKDKRATRMSARSMVGVPCMA